MKTLFSAAIAALALSLAACGGGGGGAGTVTPPTVQPTNAPTQTPATTNASGTVVNDADGTPLAGASIKLMPWTTCAATPSPATSITPEADGCATPLPVPQATTNAQGQFTLSNAPNGHYILVIGADTVSTPPPGYAPPTCTTNCGTPTPAPFTVQATVHDNVTLVGGTQALVAPTMPPAAAAGYTYSFPAWERGGAYRIATLNASTEMPCYIAWEYERAQHGLAGASIDEWLPESTRVQLAGAVATNGGGVASITSGGTTVVGGADCARSLVNATTFNSNSYAVDPRTIWFAGAYVPYSTGGLSYNEALGLAQFTIDPRSFFDGNHPTWL